MIGYQSKSPIVSQKFSSKITRKKYDKLKQNVPASIHHLPGYESIKTLARQ